MGNIIVSLKKIKGFKARKYDYKKREYKPIDVYSAYLVVSPAVTDFQFVIYKETKRNKYWESAEYYTGQSFAPAKFAWQERLQDCAIANANFLLMRTCQAHRHENVYNTPHLNG